MDERLGMIYASKNFLLGVLVEHEQKYTEPLSWRNKCLQKLTSKHTRSRGKKLN